MRLYPKRYPEHDIVIASIKIVVSHTLSILEGKKILGAGAGKACKLQIKLFGINNQYHQVLINLIIFYFYSRKDFFFSWNGKHCSHLTVQANYWNRLWCVISQSESPIVSVMRLHFPQALCMEKLPVTLKPYTVRIITLISLWETLMSKKYMILQWLFQNACHKLLHKIMISIQRTHQLLSQVNTSMESIFFARCEISELLISLTLTFMEHF